MADPGRVDPRREGPARGKITIDVEECKGCGLCIESCPPGCLELAPELSSYGVHPARYTGHDCTGCGICFYCCPEPGAITVFRRLAPPKAKASEVLPGGEHAATL
jgi:2-oxoglutarate ferredoxin oxidoreductase subunit delta